MIDRQTIAGIVLLLIAVILFFCFLLIPYWNYKKALKDEEEAYRRASIKAYGKEGAYLLIRAEEMRQERINLKIM